MFGLAKELLISIKISEQYNDCTLRYYVNSKLKIIRNLFIFKYARKALCLTKN